MAEKSSSFSYIATNDTTGIVRGELRAQGQNAALDQLEKMGLKPISVKKKTTSLLDTQIDLFEKVPPEDIYNFTRQLSVMLKAGVPLVDALDSVHSNKTNVDHKNLTFYRSIFFLNYFLKTGPRHLYHLQQ